MAGKRDYYEVLGISRDADKNAIKRAYRKLAKKYHPDTSQGNTQAEEQFKEVTEAYNVLSDPEKKKLYDQFGHAAFDEGVGGAGSSGAYGYGRPGGGAYYYSGPGNGSYSYTGPDGSFHEYHFEDGDGDMDDLLKHIFGSGFDGGFSREFGSGKFKQDGSDVQAEIAVSFEEAVFGCDKIIHLSPANDRNTGKSLKVRIPAGIDTGKTIRLRGKGTPGINGGRTGDLLLKVTVGTKPGFERKGMDVYTTAYVPYTTAVLGGEIMVQTLYGNVICKVQPGTQSGTKIRLKGKGVVSMKNSDKRGDQYVEVQIQVPRNLSEEAKKKLREFEAVCGANSKGAA